MFKQLLIVSVLLVGLSLAADQAEQQGEPDFSGDFEGAKPLSELGKLHSNLFYVSADPLEVEQTLEQLKSAKQLIESEGDQEQLFAELPYQPDHLIGLYSTEQTCNPDRAHQISQVIDYHRRKHGVTNVVEFLNFARRYQLGGCQLNEIQAKLGKTIGDLDSNTKLELPTVEKFVVNLDQGDKDELVANDKLPVYEVAALVKGFMKESGKAPRFVVRVLNDKHIKSTVSSTISLLENINLAFQASMGNYLEISKDSFAWNKLNAGERNKILVGRFCQLAANAPGLREEVDDLL